MAGKKKWYAVRKGHHEGIYESWDACKKEVIGFSGAEYKSFSTLEEANAYYEGRGPKEVGSVLMGEEQKGAVAYVDGSYDHSQRKFACGIVFFHDGKEEHFAEAFSDPTLAEMRNVAGEIKGAMFAMAYCKQLGIQDLTLCYDYEGIEKWCTGAWAAKKDGTKGYKAFYDAIKEAVQVRFVKVKGHSGDTYNELADKLAKSALGIKK